MLDAERHAVAEASRALAADGLVSATGGNVSVRRGELVAVTPTGARLGDLDAADVAVIDLDGVHRHGPLAATSERDLHLGAYRRHDVGAVVHSHAIAATAVACLLTELPVVHYEMLLLGGTVRVAPFAPFGSPELAGLVTDALDGRQAALLANHGLVAVGADLDAAVANTHRTEWFCELYLRAAGAAGPDGVRTLDAAQQDAVVAAAIARGYGATHAAPTPGESSR
ncbi:MAG: class II aldolase/adducin family protein [Solirubrobacteraceae bacterium]|nr:class II aldolase/adducin family protein [Solirubrobacteraceae bacterium]